MGFGMSARVTATNIYESFERDWRFMLPLVILTVAAPLVAAYVGGLEGAGVGVVVDLLLALPIFYLHRRAETKVKKIVSETSGS